MQTKPAAGRLLVHGGTILTMQDGPAPAEAVLIEEGRVVAVGAAELAVRNPDVPRLDLRGRVAMPGLVDTHPHMMHLATRSAGKVDLSDARNFSDIVSRFAAAAASTPEGEWLIGTPVGVPYYFLDGWYTDLEERTMPTRDVLDRASTRHPIAIVAWAPRTPNVVAFNTPGLRQLSLTDDIPDRVCDVWLDKDGEGSLTGVLRGSVNNYYTFDPFWTQLASKLPPMYPGDLLAPTKEAARRCLATGVTTIYEAHNMTAAHVEAYQALSEDPAFRLRVKAALEVESYAVPPYQPKSMAEFEGSLELALRLARDAETAPRDRYRVDGATLSEGGPCWAGLFHTLEPYRDPYGRPTRGRQFISGAKKERFARFCAEHGLRANWVNGGPGDHKVTLDVLERLADELDIPSRGWLMQHGYVITPAQIAQYRRLNMLVTTSLSFVWGKGDILLERIGDTVLPDLVPLASWLAAGSTVGLGSDWGPKDVPFEHMRLAQDHRFASGRTNNGAAQVVRREQALEMWTRSAGRAIGWEDAGHLSPGSFGDLIVLDTDPLRCSLDELAATRVETTVVGGEIVHQA